MGACRYQNWATGTKCVGGMGHWRAGDRTNGAACLHMGIRCTIAQAGARQQLRVPAAACAKATSTHAQGFFHFRHVRTACTQPCTGQGGLLHYTSIACTCLMCRISSSRTGCLVWWGLRAQACHEAPVAEHTRTHTSARTHTRTHTYTHKHTHTHMHAHTYTHTHAQTRAHAHTRTHAHTSCPRGTTDSCCAWELPGAACVCNAHAIAHACARALALQGRLGWRAQALGRRLPPGRMGL